MPSSEDSLSNELTGIVVNEKSNFLVKFNDIGAMGSADIEVRRLLMFYRIVETTK
jgi:hypothetical protein